jgi:lipopolysaccharide/colanic/teichoic acid biosynthesis glycosyltransferase
LPFEAQILLSDFQAHGLNDCVELLTRRDLQVRMRAGKKDIDLIIISRRATQQFKGNPWLLRAHLAGIPIMDYRTVTASLSGRCRLTDADLWSYVLAARPQTHFLRLYTEAKRLIEPVIALVLAIVLSPVMAAVAVAIRYSSPGPILYRQVRAGYKGRPFTLLKFRSMVQDSEKNGPQWARENDSRVTPVGVFIRKTRLDELPQLWNVFVGDMSFCGPRPERPEIYAKLEEEIPIFSLRTIVRPGITGWAQVFAGYAASVEESLLKMEYDLYYIQHMSPRLDLVILIQTIWVAIFGDAQVKNKEKVQEVKERSARALALLEASVPAEKVFEAANG